MRKMLFLLACLVMVSVMACSSSDRKKTAEVWGEKVRVDTFSLSHYHPRTIHIALERDKYVSKVSKPKSASSFGKKLSETVWKAVMEDKTFAGEITIVRYEKGLEVIKDGQSWFYDFEHMSCGSKALFSAAEVILSPGEWEPVVVSQSDQDICFRYAYDCGWPDTQEFYMWDYEQKKFGIKGIDDLIISKREF